MVNAAKVTTGHQIVTGQETKEMLSMQRCQKCFGNTTRRIMTRSRTKPGSKNENHKTISLHSIPLRGSWKEEWRAYTQEQKQYSLQNQIYATFHP